MRASLAKAAINWDLATAVMLTGAWLPYPESSALQWPVPSNYPLKAEEYVLRLQNPPSDAIWFAECPESDLFPFSWTDSFGRIRRRAAKAGLLE
jgi:hypothetical protein